MPRIKKSEPQRASESGKIEDICHPASQPVVRRLTKRGHDPPASGGVARHKKDTLLSQT